MDSQRPPIRVSMSSIQDALNRGVAGADLSRAAGLTQLTKLRTVKTRGLEREKTRLATLPESATRVSELGARITANQALTRTLAAEVAVATTALPVPTSDEWILFGRVLDSKNVGAPGLTVALYDDKGNWIDALGFSCTDKAGAFRLTFTQANLTKEAKAAKPGAGDASFAIPIKPGASRSAFAHVLGNDSKTLLADPRPITPQLGKAQYIELRLGGADPGCGGRPNPKGAGPRPTSTK